MADDPAWSDLLLGDPVVAGVETIDVGYVQLRLIARTLPGRQFEVATGDPPAGVQRTARGGDRLAGRGRHRHTECPVTPDSSGEEADESVETPTREARPPTAETRRRMPRNTRRRMPKKRSPNPTGEVILAKPPHSALVGLMAEPVSRSIPVRRSTVLMLVGFIGFGTLTICTRRPPRRSTTDHDEQPGRHHPRTGAGDHDDHHDPRRPPRRPCRPPRRPRRPGRPRPRRRRRRGFGLHHDGAVHHDHHDHHDGPPRPRRPGWASTNTSTTDHRRRRRRQP